MVEVGMRRRKHRLRLVILPDPSTFISLHTDQRVGFQPPSQLCSIFLGKLLFGFERKRGLHTAKRPGVGYVFSDRLARR